MDMRWRSGETLSSMRKVRASLACCWDWSISRSLARRHRVMGLHSAGKPQEPRYRSTTRRGSPASGERRGNGWLASSTSVSIPATSLSKRKCNDVESQQKVQIEKQNKTTRTQAQSGAEENNIAASRANNGTVAVQPLFAISSARLARRS